MSYLGATSVGKSAVAKKLCNFINAEIVIADSVQIYKYMNIGSNKPSEGLNVIVTFTYSTFTSLAFQRKCKKFLTI
jgi:tRNA A37 N6-isopentenylltransferase MiaA